MWLQEFKLAYLEEDVEKMSALLDTMPQFDTLQELEEAKYLLANAFEDASKEKQRLLNSLSEIKKSIAFINSSYDTKSYKLDITS